MSKLRIARKTMVWLWLMVLILALTYFFTHPDAFTAANIANTLRQYNQYIILAFLLVSVARAFVLIPSTPFVLAGVLLMPTSLNTALIISMLGIAISCTLIYYFSEALGFRDLFLKTKPNTFSRVEQLLRGPKGFFYLVFWAFFPVAPTDLACYIAGTVRMSFPKFLLAICLGELIICSLYVYLGKGLWELLL